VCSVLECVCDVRLTRYTSTLLHPSYPLPTLTTTHRRADAMAKAVLGEMVFNKAECTARWVTALKSGFAMYVICECVRVCSV
jgi:hypothetical protein